MRKRRFLKLASALPLFAWAGRSLADGRLSDGEVSFDWHHADDGLSCSLRAPTRGWLAVGFNDARALAGTRFVMAARSGDTQRIEERIAVVPAHQPVAALGLATALADAEILHVPGGSLLRFTHTVTPPGPPTLQLGPGHTTHLMLAWSHDADFEHHSAWRRHYDISL